MRDEGASQKEPIAFVVVSYNTVELLRECLESIARYASHPYHVVVVDNASQDGSAAMVQAKFPDVGLIALTENIGFPAAVNRGLKEADAQYYFVLNADIRLTASTMLSLADVMSKQPRAGIVAPAQQTPAGNRLLTVHKFPSPIRELTRNLFLTDVVRYRLLGSRLVQAYDHPVVVDWVMGAAMFVRKTMIEDIGFLDERVFMYGEELDWMLRAHHHGWQVWFVPSSLIIHHKSASADQAFSTHRYERVTRSNYFFWVKHYGFWRLPIFVFAQIAGSLIRMGLAAPLIAAGSEEAKRQWQEHLYTIQASLNLDLYRWIRETLRLPES